MPYGAECDSYAVEIRWRKAWREPLSTTRVYYTYERKNRHLKLGLTICHDGIEEWDSAQHTRRRIGRNDVSKQMTSAVLIKRGPNVLFGG